MPQIRAGVAGISTCRMPVWRSASTTALITAGGRAARPGLAAPRVRVRAAQDPGMRLAGTVQAVHVAAPLRREAQVLLAAHAGPMPSKGTTTFIPAFLSLPPARPASRYSAAGASASRLPCITSCAAAMARTMLW